MMACFHASSMLWICEVRLIEALSTGILPGLRYSLQRGLDLLLPGTLRVLWSVINFNIKFSGWDFPDFASKLKPQTRMWYRHMFKNTHRIFYSPTSAQAKKDKASFIGSPITFRVNFFFFFRTL